MKYSSLTIVEPINYLDQYGKSIRLCVNLYTIFLAFTQKKIGVDGIGQQNRGICVHIAGNSTLCSNESSEHIQREVALFVDKKMSEIMQANHTLSTSMASVLTAVNAVDELLKNSEAKEVLEKELEITQKSLKEAKQEIEQLSQQLQKLNEENRHLVLELTRREAELTEVRKSLDRAVGDSTHKQPRIHNIK